MGTREFYDKRYKATKANDLARIEKAVKKIGKISKYLKSPILDVGCGRGHIVSRLAGLGYKIDGTDISISAIKEAGSTYPGHNFFKHDFESARLNRKYNTVVSTEVIEYLFDYNTFLKNIALSLNEGGHIILTTPNVLGLRNRMHFLCGNGRLFKQIPHIRYFTPRTIKEVLEVNGFKDVKVFGYSSVSLLPKSFCGNMLVVASVR